jgi:hypothetical protein
MGTQIIRRAGCNQKRDWSIGAIGWYRWVNDQGAEQLQFPLAAITKH